MTVQALVATLLALTAVLACTRLLHAWLRERALVRGWRIACLLLAQVGLTGLLYLALYPPMQHRGNTGAVLTVLAEGATRADAVAAQDAGPVFALPEAAAVPGIERVPDLGTVLRRHPQVRRVRVAGFGLPVRDRDAAKAVALELLPASYPAGVSALQLPEDVAAGGPVVIAGAISAVSAARVELLDPAGRRVDTAVVDEDGGFELQAPAFAAGPATFRVRVLAEDGRVVEDAAAPVWVGETAVPRIMLMAGAPNPEVRALRRWMQDAGFAVRERVMLGGGIQLGQAPAPTAETLADVDLLVVDARAWNDLGEAGRQRVMQAVDAGMGLLLRADMPLSPAALRAVAADGFEVSGGAATTTFRLPTARIADDTALRARLGSGSRDVPVDVTAAAEALPEFARRTWRVSGVRAVPLLVADDGSGIAWWRASGRGRLALWAPLETWRLPLLARHDLYADLWRHAFAVLARGRPAPHVTVQSRGLPRVGERIALCGLGEDAIVEAAIVESGDGERLAWVPDPAAGGCAAFWPRHAGWYRVRQGDAVQHVHVFAAGALPGVRAVELRDATLLPASRPRRDTTATLASTPSLSRSASWPWFLAWLLLAAATWWFERSRHGHVAGREPVG